MPNEVYASDPGAYPHRCDVCGYPHLPGGSMLDDRQAPSDPGLPEGGVAGNGGQGRDAAGGGGGVQGTRFTIPRDLTGPDSYAIVVTAAGLPLAFTVPASIAFAVLGAISNPDTGCEPLPIGRTRG